MTLAALNKKIKSLSPEKRKAVELFIENIAGEPGHLKAKQREFGFFKGKIKMAEDFDATPSEFKNYLG
jgi:hypothetical protein